MSTTISRDLFGEVAGTTLTPPGHHPNVGPDWVAVTGTYTHDGAGYAQVATISGGIARATVDAGVSDCVVFVTVKVASGASSAGELLRYFSATEHWRLVTDTIPGANGKFYLIEVTGGVTTIRVTGTYTFVTLADNVLRCTLLGPLFTISANGGGTLTYTSSSNQTRTRFGPVAGSVGAKFKDWNLQTLDPSVLLTSPGNGQISKIGADGFTINVRGVYGGITPVLGIETQFGSDPWVDVAIAADASFSRDLWHKTGQGTLRIRSKDDNTLVDSRIGVSQGWCAAPIGQSNNSGRLAQNQVYSHATLKAGVKGKNDIWYEMFDPSDTSALGVTLSNVAINDGSNTPGGSIWPLVATRVMGPTNRPFMILPCSKGGTSSLQWQPNVTNPLDIATLLGCSMTRILAAGGVHVAPYWQGEQDATLGTSANTFYTQVKKTALYLWDYTGVPMMPFKLQACLGYEAQIAVLNTGIDQLWQDNLPYIIPGVDLSDMIPDDTFHFTTNVKGGIVADRVAAVLLQRVFVEPIGVRRSIFAQRAQV